jgi:AP2 domain
MTTNNPIKSKFRGVYKCGKRWKAQLQCQGIQFYLGTFDTEGEAAKAYDRKARDEKGLKGLTNFDDGGEHANLYGSSIGRQGCSDAKQHHALEDQDQIDSSSSLPEAKKPRRSPSADDSSPSRGIPNSDVHNLSSDLSNNTAQVNPMLRVDFGIFLSTFS